MNCGVNVVMFAILSYLKYLLLSSEHELCGEVILINVPLL